MEVQARGLRASTEQRRLDSRFKGMREEKEALVAEQSERYEKKTELELLIKDLTEDVDKYDQFSFKLIYNVEYSERELAVARLRQI